ncbi:MAG TPA: hypothetical protein VGQ95_00485 [Chthoniobacterales bacterium]|nr:hypothetical protein [Chthoniobacterales bacterium]
MSIARLIGCCLSIVLLASCGTIEDNAWGVAREDSYAIRDVVHAVHPNCKIYGYSPHEGGTIVVYTSCEPYLLRRTPHGWKIDTGVEIVIVT